MIKLGKRQKEILVYLCSQQAHNAVSTYFYNKDWKPLAKLRELGLLEPTNRGSGFGSVPTELGKKWVEEN